MSHLGLQVLAPTPDEPVMIDLTGALVLLLSEHPRQTARELLHRLQEAGHRSVDRHTINRALYGNPAAFAQSPGDELDAAPRWALHRNLEHTQSPQGALASTTPQLEHDPLWQWQHEALDAWRNLGHRGVIEAVTGTGKTMVGVAAVAEEVRRGGRALVLVPTRELQAQWMDRIRNGGRGLVVGRVGDGHLATFDECDVIVAIVNSAREHDLSVPSTSLLVADECHRYGSPANSLALSELFERRLGLSATYERNDTGREDYLDPYFGQTCFEMTYERALTDQIIASFTVALVGVEFGGDELEDYEFYGNRAAKMRHRLVSRFGVPREPFGEFMAAVSKLAQGGDGEATGIARSFLSAFSRRRALLAETPVKEDAIEGMIGAIRAAHGTIVFSQTIDGAENVSRLLRSHGIRAATVHSGLNPSERTKVLRDFGTGILKAICAPQVLDEGVDVPEADLAIIVAASKTRRQMIQRMGRILRRKRDGRLARFALLYVSGTSEDPDAGAYGTFLSDITNVASRIGHFRPGYDSAQLEAFLTSIHAVPHVAPSYEWRGVVPTDPLDPSSADPRGHPLKRRECGGDCPLCGNGVAFEVTGGYLTVLELGSPRRIHDCAHSLAVLKNLDLDSLPTAIWRAYTSAFRSAPAAEAPAAVAHPPVLTPHVDDHAVAESAAVASSGASEQGAPRSVLPIRTPLTDASRLEVFTADSAVDSTAIATVAQALLGAPNVDASSAQPTIRALRIWRAVKDGHRLSGADPSSWFMMLQGDLLRRGLIDDQDALSVHELEVIPGHATSEAPRAEPARGQARNDWSEAPARNREWGHCSSCGARIANYAALDLCARCAAH